MNSSTTLKALTATTQTGEAFLFEDWGADERPAESDYWTSPVVVNDFAARWSVAAVAVTTAGGGGRQSTRVAGDSIQRGGRSGGSRGELLRSYGNTPPQSSVYTMIV